MRDGNDGSRASLTSAMDRYADGDDAAFGELYDALGARIYAFLWRRTRDPVLAEDLLQQTFLRMHCARARFVRGADVVPWIFAIARRLLIDGVRRSKFHVSLSRHAEEAECMDPALVTLPQGDERVHSKELELRLQRALCSLPEGLRAAFELVKLDGLSMREAAEALGTSEAAVKVRVHRASRMLFDTTRNLLERSLVTKSRPTRMRSSDRDSSSRIVA
jgi:RNA polymerase sigma-70 factor (ECF subfamily)